MATSSTSRGLEKRLIGLFRHPSLKLEPWGLILGSTTGLQNTSQRTACPTLRVEGQRRAVTSLPGPGRNSSSGMTTSPGIHWGGPSAQRRSPSPFWTWISLQDLHTAICSCSCALLSLQLAWIPEVTIGHGGLSHTRLTRGEVYTIHEA